MSIQSDFFNKYRDIALQTQEETGVPAVLILAQAALESKYGNSGLTTQGNNFFGMKGQGDAGSGSYWTTEHVGNKDVRVQAPFRHYSSPEASFRDHARLISTNPAYKGVMDAAQTGNLNNVISAIHQSPYATDRNYDKILWNTIKTGGIDVLPFGTNNQMAEQPKAQEEKTEPKKRTFLDIIKDAFAPEIQAQGSAQVSQAVANIVPNQKQQILYTPIEEDDVKRKKILSKTETINQSKPQTLANRNTTNRQNQNYSSSSSGGYSPPSSGGNYSAPQSGGGGSYVVRKGETPGQIAQKTLGDWRRWKEIYSGDPRKMQIGATLNIPTPGNVSR